MAQLEISKQPCRICAGTTDGIVSLNSSMNGSTLAEMLRYCIKLEVYENDGLPYQCCVHCKLDLVVAYNLVVRCLESEIKFRKQLEEHRADVRALSAENENFATNEDQVKTESDVEDERIYAEPILDTSTKEPRTLKSEDSESSGDGEDKDDDDDYFAPDNADEDDDEEEYENKDNEEDDSDQEQDASQPKRRKYVKKRSSVTPKRCCKCKARVESQQEVEQHSKSHIESKITDTQKVAARPFECPVCFKRYTKKRALLLHQREMYIEKPFKCDECDEDFLTDAQLDEHRESHGKDKGGRKGQLPKCCACYLQFESEELLKQHAAEVHLPESQTATNDNENQFTCDICYRRYKTKRILLDHKSKPYRTKQYQCAQCGRIFRDKCALSDHERCHQGERPFVCPVCSKTFAIKDSYRKHVKSHSIEEDRFKCEMCGKGFKTKGNLKDHYITHASDYRPLSCSLCSATFARKSCLKSHMRMHTGEKPFKCNMCDASYAFSSDLKRHIMAHKGIKPYICNVCGRGYPRQDYLRKHLASHNSNN